jgi:DNA-binding SARP family transcriptional activator/predicted ATPase
MPMSIEIPLLRISLLGPLQVTGGEQAIAPPRRRDVERLLAFLILHRGRRLDRSTVAESLWPEDERALFKLRHSLLHLKKHLGAIDPELPWLQADRNQLFWDPSAEQWLDLAALEETVAKLGHCEADRLETVAVLWRGALLEGMEGDWLVQARERAALDQLRLLEALAEARKGAGDLRAAIDAVQGMLDLDSLREASHRLLMRIHLDAGDRQAALTSYTLCRDRLADELGVTPEPETEALAERARSGDLSQVHPKAAASEAAVGMRILPEIASSFVDGVGRVEAVIAALAEATLLTITGPPGCGKSRLALETARQLAEDYPAGIWWLDLRDLRGAEDLAASLARGLNAPSARGSLADAATALAAAVTGGPALLVLDNAARAVDACAALIQRLAPAAPELRVLCSSRERLALSSERPWRLKGLGLPPGGRPADFRSPAESLALMLDRMDLARRGRPVTREDAEAAAAICRLLEGSPLLIERAASSMAEMAPRALLSALLEDGVALGHLDDAPLSAGQRFDHLRGAVAWSLEAVEPETLALLTRAAAKDGAFGVDQLMVALKATTATAGASGDPLDIGDVLDGIHDLVSRSLLLLDLNAPAESRYRMPLLLRWWGRERLRAQDG